MYSIPLRRALVTQSDLPYPEGVACAEVLKVGQRRARHGHRGEPRRPVGVLWGSIVSAAFSVVVATRLFAGDVVRYLPRRHAASRGFDLFLSFALFGVGHLVGLWVGTCHGASAPLIGWIWGVPHFSALCP